MVKCLRILIACLVVVAVICPGALRAQGRTDGVEFAVTAGHLSLVDEFISRHQYSGNFTGWKLQWNTHQPGHITRHGVRYARGNRIRNYTLAAHIQEFNLSSDWLFQTARLPVFSRECTVYLGPSLRLFFHYRAQEIGTTPLQSSFLGLASVNLFSRFAYPLTPALQFNTDYRLAVFSFAGKSSENQETAGPAILSGLAATDISGDFNIQWVINHALTAKVAYVLRWMRVTRWNDFRAVSDSLSINLGIRF